VVLNSEIDIKYVDVPTKESLVMCCTFKGKKYQNTTVSIMAKVQHEGWYNTDSASAITPPSALLSGSLNVMTLSAATTRTDPSPEKAGCHRFLPAKI
jgi:hypothetical protein